MKVTDKNHHLADVRLIASILGKKVYDRNYDLCNRIFDISGICAAVILIILLIMGVMYLTNGIK